MKVLVTGGTGFIGSHAVVSLIEAGMKPIIVDNFDNSLPSVLENLKAITQTTVPFYKIDCNDQEAVNEVFETEKDIEGVIHFAAHKAVGESVINPLKYYQNNIGSLIVILKMMKKHQTPHLVFSSSCTVYGQPDQLPVTEHSPIIPAQSPYGNTKQICEEVIRDTVKSAQTEQDDFQLNAILLRYFNPIGAHLSGHIGELPLGVPNNLVPYIIQTAAGIREKLTIFGKDYNTPDGTCVRDYIHVMDLADAHVKALQLLVNKKQTNNTCEVFNIGTGKGNSVQELVQTFEKVNNLKLNYEFGNRRPGDVEQIYASVAKANQELGWQAQRSLEEGLRDAWNWQQKLMK
ncbi:UDP-glucose 4-epimerase GalE [marine bacterium AO1-C]|nr:UDP-glucose 4-epimerase GalE [marine bacterium AO1-C]